MADEQTCYAGDLTTDHIGKVIRFSPTPGVIVEDRLRSVIFGDVLAPVSDVHPPRVWIEVENVKPKHAAILVPHPIPEGWTLAHTDQVTVKP